MKPKFLLNEYKILIIFCAIFCWSCGIEKQYYVSKKKYLIENIQINDSTKAKMIFDTGSSQLLFDSIFFEKSNLSRVYKNLLLNHRKNDFNGIIILDTVKYSLNSIENYSYPSGIVNLNKILGNRADGIIGLNTSNSNFIKIQPSLYGGKVGLFEELEIPKGYVKTAAIFSKDRIFADVVLQISKNQSLKLRLLIDTGYPGEVLIFNNDSLMIKLEKTEKLFYETLNDNIKGESYGYRFLSKKIKFFDFEEKHVITDFQINQSSSDIDFDGLVGMGLLNNYNIIIEKNKLTMYLKKNNKHSKLMHSTLGLSLIESSNNCHFLVNSIIKNSDAEIKGIRLNDTILEINNIPSYKIDDAFFEKLNNSKRKYYKIGVLKNGLFQEINIKKHEFIL
jgi:hypothetical protein